MGGALLRVFHGWAVEAEVLLVAAVILPVAIGVHYGSIASPNSDDWAYDLSAFHLAFHGGFDLYHWGPSNLVGQLVLVAPVLWLFGAHVWVLNLWTCCVGLIGLLALDYLGRRLGLSRAQSLFAAAVLGLGPMWAALSTSFMLDIPAFSFMTLSLAIAASDARTDRILTSRSLLAVLVAGVAFTIRDEAVIAIAAIAWCRLWRNGRPSSREAMPWIAAVGAAGVLLVGFELWRVGIPSRGHGYPLFSPTTQWLADQWFLPLAGLMLVPAALAVGPMRVVKAALRCNRNGLLVLWTLMPGLPLVAYIASVAEKLPVGGYSYSNLVRQLTPSFGNAYFNLWGYAPVRGRLMIPAWTVDLLGVLSVGATLVADAALILALSRWRCARTARTSRPSHERYVATILAVVVAGSWVIFAAGIKLNLQAWDRYLLPLVGYLPILMLRGAKATSGGGVKQGRSSNRWLAACLGFGALASLSAAVTFGVDGFVGSEWAFSEHFAHSVEVPSGEVYTFWAWSAMQNRLMVDSDPTYTMKPGYQPCFVQETNVAPHQGLLAFTRGGSWVEPYTYAIVPAPGSATRPQCKAPDTGPT